MNRSNFILLLISVIGNLAYGFSSPSNANAFIMSALSKPFSSKNKSSLSFPKQTFTIADNKKTDSESTTSLNSHRKTSSSISVAANLGGAIADSSSPFEKVFQAFSSLWASTGVIYILMKAVKRVLPIALDPFKGGSSLSPFQLASYIGTCLFFAYAEGYKGFQKKFSPLVVSRSFTLEPKLSKLHHTILAPLYAMGLFHATKKRMIVSWSVSMGVAAIVAGVKRLPYPWRNIVDAGVVVGLSWGALSIMIGYMKALWNQGHVEGVDPCLPE